MAAGKFLTHALDHVVVGQPAVPVRTFHLAHAGPLARREERRRVSLQHGFRYLAVHHRYWLRGNVIWKNENER